MPATFQQLEAEMSVVWGTLRTAREDNKRLRTALQAAKEKLMIFRKETSGEYKGGMEYKMLMDLIDAALGQSLRDK